MEYEALMEACTDDDEAGADFEVGFGGAVSVRSASEVVKSTWYTKGLGSLLLDFVPARLPSAPSGLTLPEARLLAVRELEATLVPARSPVASILRFFGVSAGPFAEGAAEPPYLPPSLLPLGFRLTLARAVFGISTESIVLLGVLGLGGCSCSCGCGCGCDTGFCGGACCFCETTARSIEELESPAELFDL